MNNTFPLSLSQDQRLMLARACSLFLAKNLMRCLPGRLQIFLIIGLLSTSTKSVERMLQGPSMLYSSYRTRVQRAGRYIETDESEFREVLRVEVTLLDAILFVLALLLDVIHGMLASSSGGGGEPLATLRPASLSAPEVKPYVPTWKRQAYRIGFDEPFL
ncbi:hypothetical protein ACXM5X_25245 [Pseudomonas saponiphila]